jgi:hypothetical protein
MAGPDRTLAKPLTTQFVKRQPRLTKPLELKKRPRPKRRATRRTMVAVKARGDQLMTATQIRTPRVLQGLARPSSPLARSTYFASDAAEPSAVAQAVESSREPKKSIDTSLEMLDVGAMDTGQYHAMVIQDPGDRRSVRGFFHLHPVYSVSMRNRGFHGIDGRTLRALVNLAAAMNEHTQIRVDIAPEVTFDSRALFKTPWMYVTAHEQTKGFQITASESSNLGAYLTAGGFVFTETVSVTGNRIIGTAWEIALRQLVKDALHSQGLVYDRDYTYEPLPGSHPLYHCFFDFTEAPDYFAADTVMDRPDYLEGITLDGRLVAIASAKCYFYVWNDDWQQYGWHPTRPRQFGVNLLVFALTQEGSITQQVMHSVD